MYLPGNQSGRGGPDPLNASEGQRVFQKEKLELGCYLFCWGCFLYLWTGTGCIPAT